MGLIINRTIQKMIIGFPTVSDKYNVSGAMLDGSNPVKFGDVVVAGTTAGCFAKPTSISAATDVMGFVVGTNVKLAENWPGTTVQVNPGEAFNLLINGFIAVELNGANPDPDDIVPNGEVRVGATGTLTTSSDTGSTYALNNVVFTGVYENQGTTANPKYVAEIYVK